MGIRKRSWSGRWTQTKYTKLQLLTKQIPREKLLYGSTYIGARGGGQGGGSPDEKVIDVLSQVCLCSPNLSPEHVGLGLYFLLAKSDVRGLFEQQVNSSFSLIFICGLYKCPIHLQLYMAQKFVKYICPG